MDCVPTCDRQTVVGLFQARVSAAPDDVAVVDGCQEVTYAELDAAATGLAYQLIDLGVGAESVVAIHLRRSVEMVVALLGVARSGAAYLPLDPGYPVRRREFILRDAGASVVLTTPDLPTLDTAASTLYVGGVGLDAPEGRPLPLPGPRDRAYVMYTSGSTGRPKGVDVAYDTLMAQLAAFRDLLGCAPGDVWLGLTSLSFDPSVLELFLPLTTGGRLVTVPESAITDGHALLRLIRDHAVTHVQATPSGWSILLAARFHEPAVVALIGGEAAPLPMVRTLRARVRRLVNLYGPTETTVWSTAADIPPDPVAVPIGRPLSDTRVYVLDQALAPVPEGGVGEIFVGGDGVSRGYLRRPGLTAGRFLPDPFSPVPGARCYRSGDLARVLPDGQLEFHGRADHQVKIRGHRIELGEIEAALSEHPGLLRAAVTTYRDGESVHLAAYLVAAAPPGPDPAAVQAHLARLLPAYMVPDTFVTLPRLPLTPSGKVDRRRLPAPVGPPPAAPAPRSWGESASIARRSMVVPSGQ
jgi:amino acid adenylation domain-containing protein